jgi:hypothetical protein
MAVPFINDKKTYDSTIFVKLRGESTKQFKRDELYTFEDIVGM